MNPNYEPEQKQEVSTVEIEAAKQLVKQAIKDNGGYAYWSEIRDRIDCKATASTTSAALNSMIIDGLVRQKEDEIEHDWEYMLTRKGKGDES